MPVSRLLRLTLPLLLWCGAASAQQDAQRRPAAPDAGVPHTPVLTRAPELTTFVEAPYPAEAEARGLEGSVNLRLTLDAGGRVAEAEVVEGAGHGFDEAALAAVRAFRFTPAEVDGQPAPVQLEYVYHFKLAVPPPPPAPPPPPPAVLAGELLARGSRTHVAGATVRCGDAPDAPEATSDEAGRFTLTTPAGACAVRVVAQGYQRFETSEPLQPGVRTEVRYFLVPRAPGFETVVRSTREKKEVVRRTLERQELQRVPGTFGDPIRVLQNLPGVARAPFVSGALIVRGASPDQTVTLLDGVDIPLLYHLGGGPSVVNADFLDRIDFYPGGFGARYGRAVGGAVDVATRKGAQDTLHGTVKVDLLDAGFFAEAPLAPGLSVAAAARRSYVDALLPLVLPDDPEGGTLLIAPRYWDYQVRLDVGAPRGAPPPAPGEARSSGYVMAFGSDDLLSVVATGGGRNRDVSVDVRTLFHRVKGDWTWRKGALTSVLTPYAGYDLAHFTLGSGFRVRADTYSLGGREDLTLELGPALVARAGADVKFEHLVGDVELPVFNVQYPAFPGAEPRTEPQQLDRVVNAFDGALYAELDVTAGPVTLTPGVRATYARLHGETRTALDPRLWVRWRVREGTSLKASTGLYSQAPDALDLEDPPLGNPALGFEHAFQTSVGVEQQLTEALGVDLTGFFNRRFDLVVSPGRTTVNDDGSVTRPLYGNLGLGRAYGLELLVRHAVTRDFFGWLAYTLNRSEARRAGDDPYRLTPYDQTHLLTAVASHRLPWGLELGARFRYVTGRPDRPLEPQGDRYGVDRNRFTGVFGAVGSTRLRPFHQLDLRLDKSWLFEQWTLAAYLDVQNVYNARNTEAVLYDYRYREAAEVPGLPFLPVLGVRGSF